MKLFGGKTEGGHVSKSVPPQNSAGQAPPAPQRKAGTPGAKPEKTLLPLRLITFFKSGGARRMRTPLLIAGCLILVVLAAVIAHAVLVRSPEVEEGGLNRPAAIRPAVTSAPLIATPPPETPEPTETPEPIQTPEPVVRKDDIYTFVLLVRDQISGNTDTILVGRMDTAAQRLDFVNVPRDTLVNVSWEAKKASTIYPLEHNDPERFLDHLSDLIGFRADNYAVADLRALEQIVDAMGGLSVNVPRDMDYDDPDQDLHIHIPAGFQWLNGADTVKVLRYRMGNDGTGYATGDIGRIHTQQQILKAVAEQFLTLKNIPNIKRVAEIFTENVKTDLTVENLLFYAEEFLLMKKDNIRFHTAPGVSVGIRNTSYYELELEGWIDIVNEALNPWSAPITAENLDILRSLGGREGAVSTTGEVIPYDSFF